ncbi:protein containing Glycoside hydrolase, family 13, partial [Rhodopirellula maiorica SM1]
MVDASLATGQDAKENQSRVHNIANSKYRIQMTNKSGETVEMNDPYAAPSILTDFDNYLIGQGKHYELYERLGAQLRTVDGKPGVNFAVWAPNARSVQVVGDFNGWDGRKHVARI